MAKTTLFDDDDSASENGFAETARGQELKINEEYARRFEHNKKRAEIHRRRRPIPFFFSFPLANSHLSPAFDLPADSINNQSRKSTSPKASTATMKTMKNPPQTRMKTKTRS